MYIKERKENSLAKHRKGKNEFNIKGLNRTNSFIQSVTGFADSGSHLALSLAFDGFSNGKRTQNQMKSEFRFSEIQMLFTISTKEMVKYLSPESFKTSQMTN